MTRKHFQALADALASVRPSYNTELINGGPQFSQWEHTVNAVADACSRSNGAFDHRRFTDAATLTGPLSNGSATFEVFASTAPPTTSGQ